MNRKAGSLKKSMMARYILLILLVCVSGTSIAAKRKGWFITHSGDTVHVVFRIPVGLFASEPTYEKLQWRITYYGESPQPQTLLPAQAREVWFEFKTGAVRLISIPAASRTSHDGTLPHKDLFLRLIADGNLRLYAYYDYDGYAGTDPATPDPVLREAPGSTRIYVLQKQGGDLYVPRTGSQPEQLRDYLSDCPKVASSIDNRSLRYTSLVQLVEVYNNSCSK